MLPEKFNYKLSEETSTRINEICGYMDALQGITQYIKTVTANGANGHMVDAIPMLDALVRTNDELMTKLKEAGEHLLSTVR